MRPSPVVVTPLAPTFTHNAQFVFPVRLCVSGETYMDLSSGDYGTTRHSGPLVPCLPLAQEASFDQNDFTKPIVANLIMAKDEPKDRCAIYSTCTEIPKRLQLRGTG